MAEKIEEDVQQVLQKRRKKGKKKQGLFPFSSYFVIVLDSARKVATQSLFDDGKETSSVTIPFEKTCFSKDEVTEPKEESVTVGSMDANISTEGKEEQKEECYEIVVKEKGKSSVVKEDPSEVQCDITSPQSKKLKEKEEERKEKGTQEEKQGEKQKEKQQYKQEEKQEENEKKKKEKREEDPIRDPLHPKDMQKKKITRSPQQDTDPTLPKTHSVPAIPPHSLIENLAPVPIQINPSNYTVSGVFTPLPQLIFWICVFQNED